MNIAGFEKIAPYLTHPLALWSCFGMLFLVILLVMGAVIFLGGEDKAIWIPAAIAMLGIAVPAALNWKDKKLTLL